MSSCPSNKHVETGDRLEPSINSTDSILTLKQKFETLDDMVLFQENDSSSAPTNDKESLV
jgi:hypothetical protein